MENFRKVLEIVGDQVWEYNVQTDLLEVAEGEGPWTGQVHPDDCELLQDARNAYRSGTISRHRLEYRLVTATGETVWVLDRGALMETTADGQPFKVIGAYTDITRRKQTEEELERRVRQFSSLSENIPGVIFEYEYYADGSEGFRYISPAVERIFGVNDEGLQTILNEIDVVERNRINSLAANSRDHLRPFYTELQLNFPNIGRRWCAIQSAYSFSTQQRGMVFTGLISDVTEQRVAEDALKANEEKYRNIIANMNLGLLEVDQDEIITYANQRFCTMSGFTVGQLLGKKASAVLLDEANTQIVAENQAMRKKGIYDAYELHIHRPAGKEKWWLVSAAPRYNDKGELVGSIGIHLDISGQKRLEHELITARERAEHLAGAKEQFLAHMSHELRTPLNAIIGMAVQLDKTQLAKQQRSLLETVHTAAEQLLAIINDILDLSKLEAGQLPIEQSNFSLLELFRRAVMVLAPKAEEKGLRLVAEIDSSVAAVLAGDPFRLNQVILNLLSNAVKFTESGGVTLTASVVADSPDGQLIKIQVTDTGTGMDADFLAHLFDKFSQENRSISRRFGGTGLGMSISRELIVLMGGTISASSKKGKGTMITIELPFDKGKTGDLLLKETINYSKDFLKDKAILVVDDNALNRRVAELTLQFYGARVRTLDNGLEVLESMEDDATDLILMDLQMPEMDGYATVTRLRAANCLLPIVALTAEAVSGERQRCTAAGMDDYLSKPFREEDLLQLIGAYLYPSAKLYDLSGLEKACHGSQEFMNEMTALFCTQTAKLLPEMQLALTARDRKKLGIIAHQLKPAIDALRIAGCDVLIRDLEKADKNGKSDAELVMLYAKLNRKIGWAVALLGKD